jgi:hypothetical protein
MVLVVVVVRRWSWFVDKAERLCPTVLFHGTGLSRCLSRSVPLDGDYSEVGVQSKYKLGWIRSSPCLKAHLTYIHLSSK